MNRGSPATSRSSSANRSGDEQSSEMTQTQSSTVWARIESSWRASRPAGGSKVAMQIATAGAAAETGATGSASGIDPHRERGLPAAGEPGAQAEGARRRSRAGAIRARPQNPLA